jgi:hypothetical protein
MARPLLFPGQGGRIVLFLLWLILYDLFGGSPHVFFDFGVSVQSP